MEIRLTTNPTRREKMRDENGKKIWLGQNGERHGYHGNIEQIAQSLQISRSDVAKIIKKLCSLDLPANSQTTIGRKLERKIVKFWQNNEIPE